MSPKVIYSNQKYSCKGCGLCCRRFRVQLTPQELKALQEHEWESVPSRFHDTIDGLLFFKRTPESRCVFLDECNRCRIHSRLGEGAKALSCRGYPFSIVPTFPNEITVSVRLDCPAAMADDGIAVSQNASVAKIISAMHFNGNGFSEKQLGNLTVPTAKELIKQIYILLDDATLSVVDAMNSLMLFSQHAEQLGAVFLNDTEVMTQVYPKYADNLKDELPELLKYDFGKTERMMFRRLMAAYCRRDEELLRIDILARIRLAWRLAKIMVGRGNLRKIGNEHPDFSLGKMQLFSHEKIDLDKTAWLNYFRFLRIKLETCQFFGQAYYCADIFTGLKALFMTFPLALALARINAMANDRVISSDDVNYAVAAIDHSFGRNPAIGKILKLQNRLSGHFSSLVFALCGQ